MAKSLFRSFFSTGIELTVASLLGLLLAPFVLRHVGQEHYGLWVLVLSITGQLVLFELGAQSALIALLPGANSENRTKLVGSAFLILLVAALAAITVSLGLASVSASLFELAPQAVPIFQTLLVIAGADVATAIIVFLFASILSSRERYDLISSSNILRLVINAVAIVIALRTGMGIVSVAVLTLIFRLAQRVLLIHFAKREDPSFSLTLTTSECSKLLNYGKWTFLVILTGRLINQVDTIVIGVFLGAVAVTAYAIPLLLIDQFRVLVQTGSAILIPRLAALTSCTPTETQTSAIHQIIFGWARVGSLISIGIGIPIILYGDDFITLWMGAPFPLAHSILSILIAPFFLTIPTFGLTGYLFASKKHFIIAKIQGMEAAANIFLSVALVQYLGIVGAAYGTLLPALIFSGVLLPQRACREAGVSFSHFCRTAYSTPTIFAAIYFAVLFILGRNVGSSSWSSLILIHWLGGIFFTFYAWYIYLPSDARAYVRRRLGLAK